MKRPSNTSSIMLLGGSLLAATCMVIPQSTSAQQVRNAPADGQQLRVGNGVIGERQEREDAAPTITPNRRIETRLETRVASRIENRIDRQADTQAQFSADERIRAASQAVQRTNRPQNR